MQGFLTMGWEWWVTSYIYNYTLFILNLGSWRTIGSRQDCQFVIWVPRWKSLRTPALDHSISGWRNMIGPAHIGVQMSHSSWLWQMCCSLSISKVIHPCGKWLIFCYSKWICVICDFYTHSIHWQSHTFPSTRILANYTLSKPNPWSELL